MRYSTAIIIIIHICYFITSCNRYDFNEVVAYDNIYIENISSYDTNSRGTNDSITGFSTEDTILFNSYGTHENKNNLVFHDGMKWTSNEPMKWNTQSNDSLYFSAIYPVLSEQSYTKSQLYNNGSLTDILFCKSKEKYMGNISIFFKHLFSTMRINLNGISDDSITSVSLKSPVSVKSIDLQTGYILLENNDTVTSAQTVSKDNTCSFIIPPAENVSFHLQLNSKGNSISTTIPAFTYKSGEMYSCNIKKKSSQKGIRNANDLIILSRIMNGYSYDDKKLEDFYYMENGRRIFSILNDITLTEAESDSIIKMGSLNAPFKDVFDGNNHIISNLNFTVNSTEKSLFNYIDTVGVVKNIRIHNSSIEFTKRDKYGCFISLNNKGTIDNCKFDNCFIKTYNSNTTALISTSSFGYITNCGVTNSKISGNTNCACSLIARRANGEIINCYLANNTLTYDKATSTNVGAISVMSDNDLKIKNCYIKCYSPKSKKVYQYICINYIKLAIENCFTKKGIALWNEEPSIAENHYITEDFNEESSGESVITLMNEWIDNNQVNYPNIKLMRWRKYNSDIPAIHIE